MKFAIVGAGFSGSVIARELAEAGHDVHVFDQRTHIAGNCHTERDEKTNILVHKYGPHIFHTDDENVWDYVNKFSVFMPYVNRVKATYQDKVYSLPVNLHTINQFFNKAMRPEEAMSFVKDLSLKFDSAPTTFEEQGLAFVGEDLYKAFFYGYTKKQWGVSPSELPASILKRLPLRFNYDDNYFNHKYQGMPKDGYTELIKKILDHEGIVVKLNTAFNRGAVSVFDHVIYSGPIDEWFSYDIGRLGYRTLDFEAEYSDGDYQGCAVMNFSDENVEHTRISEHKHFAPWESHKQTITFKEYSRLCTGSDIPYYPIRLVSEKEMLNQYIVKAKNEKKVSFVGRLGTYRYLDMDVTIREAIDAAAVILNNVSNSEPIPAFFVNPL